MHWSQQSLHNHSGDRMFKAVIPEMLKLREAPSHGISIFEYDANRIGAKAYRELMALKRSILGNNRLAQGIFSKTEPEEESLIKNQESITINQESSFLIDGKKEKINLRLSLELIDWLDNLLKQGKRKHGQKIAKEVWVQALLEII